MRQAVRYVAGALFAAVLLVGAGSIVAQTARRWPTSGTAAAFEGGALSSNLDLNGNSIEDTADGSVTVAAGDTIDVPNGSFGAPSYTFTNDTDTGLYSPGAGNLSFTVGGTQRMSLTTSSLLLQTGRDLILKSGRLYDNSGALSLGRLCTTSHGLGTFDVCVGGGSVLEVDGQAWFDGAVTLKKVTSDPCGSDPEGSVFYNDTSDILCICNGAGADVKVSDGAACFP